MADRLEAEIADKRRSREENTPKKQLQAKTARIEADHLERVQRAMYALAEAQENDRLPENLKAIKTNSQLMTMLKTRLDGSRGYYELIDTGEYSDKSELAVTLRAFIESCKSEAEAARLVMSKSLHSAASSFTGSSASTWSDHATAVTGVSSS